MIPRMATAAPKAGAGSAGVVETEFLDLPAPVRLDCGRELHPIRIAYETYGTHNADKSNAILICHALTGDQYVATQHPVTKKPGMLSK